MDSRIPQADPYKPPSARVDDATVEDISRSPARRPLFVWIITAYYGFGLTLNLLVMVISVLGFGKSAPGILHSSRNMPVSMFIDIWAVGVVQATGVVLLFRLRAAAPYLFVASFLVGMIHRFDEFYALGLERFEVMIMKNPTIATGFITNAAVIWYVFHLRAKGILR